MPNLEIKDWYLADTIDPAKGPPNPRDFCIDFRVDVGEVGKEGVSNHQVFVCTPLGLLSSFERLEEYLSKADSYQITPNRGAFFARGILIVREYNLESILATLNAVTEHIERYTIDVT